MTDIAGRLSIALGERYEIGEIIGAGGMATVFRARDLKHGREVAIKVLRSELAASLGGDRFLREIRIAANLHHPHILQLFDSGEAEGLLYYIMPLVRGETLRELMKRSGPLSIEETVRLVGQVASALDHAHQHGIVHRDIKPENILLESGHALVADFGVGRAVSGARQDAAGTLTEAGLVVGTPAYMSPEQIDGAAIDGRSDLYSLGCVCYEMFAGTPPFVGATISSMMRQHVLTPAPSISRKRPDIPASTDLAVQKALAKSPDDRFATVGEFAQALHTGLTPTAVQSVSTRRGQGLAWAAAGIGIILLVAGYLLWSRMRPAGSASESAVAVLPFSVRGNDTLQLGEGMVTLLSTKLDGAGDLRTVDARALLGYIERSGNQSIDVDRAREIAAQFSAQHFVLGDVVILGDRVQLSAGFYAVNENVAVEQTSVEGATNRVFELVDALAAKLLAKQSNASGTGLEQVASVTTSSLPAFKAYLDGEREMRQGNFDRALSAYQQALAADSNFALAWYRLSVAAEWLTLEAVVQEGAAKAQQLSAHLPDRVRSLLDASQAAREGQTERAEQLYRTITGAAPEDVESWMQLGELLFHNGALSGRNFRESRAPWQRVMALEPDNIIPLIHLARIAAADRDTATLDDMVARVSRIRAGSGQDSSAARVEELELAMMRAAMVNDSAAIARLSSDLARGSELTVTITTWDVATTAGNFTAAIGIADLLTTPGRSTQARSLGCRIHGTLLFGLGQFKAGNRHLDRCVAIDPALGVLWRIYYAALPMREQLESALPSPRSFDSIVAPAAPTPSGMSSFMTANDGTYDHVRVYLEGLTAAIRGDSASAERSAARLQAMPGSRRIMEAAAKLADGIRSEIAYRGQRWNDALALLSRPSMAGYLLAGASPFFAASRERFRQAELLQRAGQHEEALKWYGSFESLTMFEAPFMAAGLKAQGEIFEALGRKPEAIEAYRRFITLWTDADPELQPMVTQARERIEALGAEP